MASKTFKFGLFTLQPDRGELSRRGIPIKLQDQTLQTLCYLVERPNQIVSREELRAHLWPDTYVDFDLALNTAVRKLRQALSDSAENPRFIETLPKRGYRFIAPVDEISPESAQPPAVIPIVEQPVAELLTEDQLVMEPPPADRRWKWVVAGLLAVSLLGTAIWAAIPRAPRSAPIPRLDSVAVLPFVNEDHEPSIEYLGDGLAESLIGSLSELRSLRVMASGTTASFKGRDPRAAGRELKVAAIIQGRIYQRAGMLVVDADLVNATNGEEVWRGRYRRRVEDALDLEEEIAAEVTRKLRESLTEGTVSAAQLAGSGRTTRNKVAYSDYLQGLFEMRQLSSAAENQAMGHFEQAIALDPNYVPAYIGLADTYEILYDWVLSPADTVPKARSAIQKALDLDPTLSEAHMLMGTVHFWYDYDQAAAEKEFRRAIELNSNLDDAHDYYGWFLATQKRFDQSFAEHHRAIELSPFDLQHHLTLAQSLYYARRYDEASEELQAALRQNPGAWWGHELLGWVYEQKGDLRQSIAELKRSVELEGKIPEPLASLGRVYAIAGDREAALRIQRQLNETAKRSYVSPWAMAILDAGLGEDERAIAEIGSAYEKHSWLVNFLGVDPKLDRLRSDPRLERILRQAGLP